MKLAKIVCKIEVGDKYAVEYQEKYENHPTECPTKTCYIISENGKPFAFYLDLTHRANIGKDFSYNMFIDGINQISKVKAISRTSEPSKYSRSSVSVGKGMREYRDLKFAKLETIEQGTPINADELETRHEVLGQESLRLRKIIPNSPENEEDNDEDTDFHRLYTAQNSTRRRVRNILRPAALFAENTRAQQRAFGRAAVEAEMQANDENLYHKIKKEPKVKRKRRNSHTEIVDLTETDAEGEFKIIKVAKSWKQITAMEVIYISNEAE